VDVIAAAEDLAAFIRALHACDATNGPQAGAATWLRGRSLRLWRERIDEWIAKSDLDLTEAKAAWYEALEADEWNRPAVWFHGDFPGNLIQRDGRLVGVIDSPFGVGDPACDLMAGWTFFRGEARRVFFDEVGMDDATVARSRGWALGPALIGVAYYKVIASLRQNALDAIAGALAD
jgi:aminoglycoside phosphotransferase (APT) family kinase protein